MNKIISIVAIALAIIAIIFTGLAIKKSVNVVNDIRTPEFGAVAGPHIYNPINIHESFTWGGRVLATTTASKIATTTLSGSDLATYGYFKVENLSTNVTGRTADAAYKLPATSTMMGLLPDIGSTRRWIFHNATSSALTFSIEVPTGIDLVAVTGADDYIDSGEWMELTCTQISYRNADNENIVCKVTELANAD